MSSWSSMLAEIMKLLPVTHKRVRKQKLLKYGRPRQWCKKHTPIGFSRNHAHKFVVAVQKMKIIINNNMEKWVVWAKCQKSCILFPMPLILLCWL